MWSRRIALLILTLPMFPPAIAVERLNNLVTELTRVDAIASARNTAVEFRNPRRGWVHIQLRAGVRGAERVELLQNGVAWIRIDASTGPTGETMRLLPEGAQTIEIRGPGVATAGPLVVRAIPELQFVRYPQQPRIPQHGNFDWEWLRANVLPAANTIAGAPNGIDREIEEWRGMGRKFIAYAGLPHDKDLTGPKALEQWLANPGFRDPRLSGLIADEFSGRQHPLYPAWIEGMRLLGEKMQGTGRAFYAYTGGPGMYSRPEARALVRTLIDAGFFMAWERYHHEMPTEPEAREYMDRILGGEIAKWRAAFPKLLDHLVMVLGIFQSGPELNVQPEVNYKVWMDMQMQYLATHPGFDGLYGVQWWYSGGATEEILRWQSALYRHYCIEGRTGLLSRRHGWTYSLPHIANPDFLNGLDGWDARPAAAETLKAGYLERYARMQNRYWQRGAEPDYPSGNAFLWTRRSAARPNTVTQQVKHLVPGRLYSVSMITADYQDMVQARSVEKRHAVSIAVEGADEVAEGAYRSVPVKTSFMPRELAHFKEPPWLNHHRVMFRATGPSATLTISDWESARNPGGPEGQELMFNYVQVEPYFERRDNSGR